MSTSSDEEETAVLSPEEAFAILGNETRIEILRTLGEADGPVTFTELRDRVGIRQGSQFNYHLDKLVGHFVRKTDDGYALRPAAERVIEAVLSGLVTNPVNLPPTPIDRPCPFCGETVLASYYAENLMLLCPGCPGRYALGNLPGLGFPPEEYGYLGRLPLPPAGIQSRSLEAAWRSAWIWANLEFISMSTGVCPRCSGSPEYEIVVCDSHPEEGFCEDCGTRFAVLGLAICRTCNYEVGGQFSLFLMDSLELLAFLAANGRNPVSPDDETPPKLNTVHTEYAEEVLSTEPFEARFTFTIGDDALTLTVDDDLTVVESTRHDISESI
jgi:hypothetical protein